MKFLFLCTALLIPIHSFSQTDKVIFDVGFVKIDESYTKAQIVSLWGQPRTYYNSESEFGVNESYYYGKNSFEFHKGYMTFFYLKDDMFPIFTSYVPGGIKVGDPITLFSRLNFGKLSLKEKAEKFLFQMETIDDGIEVTADKNGIITSLLYQETN